jgi:hypothetical protein
VLFTASTDSNTNLLCCATCATLVTISTAFASDGGCPSGSCAALTSYTPDQNCCVPGLWVADADLPVCAEPFETTATATNPGWSCAGGCVLGWALPSAPLCCPQGTSPDRGPDGGDASADAPADTDVDASADAMPDAINGG